MAEASLDTVRLHVCVQRWQAGDAQAADELLRTVSQRLEQLTRKMLRGFPAVRNWADTADVLQSSLLRLLHSLRQMQPCSTRHFFNLAALHIRRELLRLTCRFKNRRLVRLPGDVAAGDRSGDGLSAVSDENVPDYDFELWCRFHEAVKELPAEEQEVVGLVFYHGWTQARIAEVCQVDERTVRRRWQSACLRLNQLVGENLPQA